MDGPKNVATAQDDSSNCLPKTGPGSQPYRKFQKQAADSPSEKCVPPPKRGNLFIRTQYSQKRLTEDGLVYTQYTCLHCGVKFKWRTENASRLTDHILQCEKAPDEIKQASKLHTQRGRRSAAPQSGGTPARAAKRVKLDEKDLAILDISKWISKTIGFRVIQQDIQDYAECFFRMGLQSGEQIDACLSAEAFEEEKDFRENLKKFHYTCILKKLKEAGTSE